MTFHTNHPGQRHDPGVFLQIAFSVPQQLWNYSSWRKPLSSPRWSTRTAVAIPIWNGSEKVISWSQSRAKLKTSFFFLATGGCIIQPYILYIFTAWHIACWLAGQLCCCASCFLPSPSSLKLCFILNLLLAQRSVKKVLKNHTLFTEGHSWAWYTLKTDMLITLTQYIITCNTGNVMRNGKINHKI